MQTTMHWHNLVTPFLMIFATIANVDVDGLPLTAIEGCSILDLSHSFSNETTISWPGNPQFELVQLHKGNGIINGEEVFYATNRFCAAEHSGTHLDAPIHFSETGQTAEEVPLSSLIGEACMINVSAKAAENQDYQLTVDDLVEWENLHAKISNSCILLVDFGWEQYWHDKIQYLGGSLQMADMHFPGISPDAATWLTTNRSVRAIGVNVASLDYGQTKTFKTHQILASAQLPLFENLKNLGKLPPRRATIIALPMKISEGTGGPLRAIAIGWDGPDDPCRRAASKAASLGSRRLSYVIFLTLMFMAQVVPQR